jgi:hypothetical protein
MSQRDLAAELRAARITAPAEVRERVRLIAADDTTPTRRFTWRRALVVALPVAAAVAATIVFTRPSGEHTTFQRTKAAADKGVLHGQRAAAPQVGAPGATLAPLSVPNRLEQFEATLSLRVPTADGVSSAMQRALRIARSYGGYPVYVDAGSQAKRASADLTLKVPRTHVREAMRRLAALGTITAEHLDVQDVTAGVNETDRTIARMQHQLAELRKLEQTPTVQRKIAQLTASVVRLQRQRATTVRNAHFATINLHLATPARVAVQHHVHHGPLHRLGTALIWLGIGAIYVVVLGTPVLLAVVLLWFAARAVRRWREDALLSQH